MQTQSISKVLNRSEVEGFLRGLNGRFFTVTFVKRTTGELRTMNATTNYKTKTVGGELSYSAKAKSLIPVWDLTKGGFRSIPTDAVTEIKANGETYTIV